MACTQDEEPLRCKFARDYELGRTPAMREIERRVLGTDYGATSWTTRAEAARIAEFLGLCQGVRLLEVGAGSGWPSLFLAKHTGCDAVLVDLPLAGLQIAVERARADDMHRRCQVLAADGARLPFAEDSFDALNHCDVLCCLPAKLLVLRECRRVASKGARMAFSVVEPAPALSAAEHRIAVESGPPHVDVPADYALLLGEARWRLLERIDVTAEFMRSHRTELEAIEAGKDALIELLGSDKYQILKQRRLGTIAAVANGLLKREIFVATVAA